jgi:hypothetical protein
VAVGDFNGDGKSDLATANTGSNNVSVLLGNGSGGFATAVSFAVGEGPVSVAVGDFNGDGRPDLATANELANNVSVLLGNGSGGFATAVNYLAGTDPSSVAVGDFNEDGKPDLAVANFSSKYVSILLSNGTGGFATAANYFVDRNQSSVAVGDYNRDGKPDLFTTDADGGRFVFVRLSYPDRAGYSPPYGFFSGTGPSSVAMDDFNGDGKPDLVVANTFSNDVRVHLQDDGRILIYPVGVNPVSVAVGDFNGDGRPDLVTANETSNNVSVHLLPYASPPYTPVNFAVGDRPSSVAVGDFNGDGRPDLATANFNSNNVSVLINCPPPNTPPTLTTLNPSQTATAGVAFSYTVNAFTDTETPDGLTYSATIEPARGLSFDPATRIISGTPTSAGVSTVTVTATDPGSLWASTEFTITVSCPDLTASINPSSATLSCTTPSVSLTASGGESYRWDDNSTSAIRSVSTAGTYSLTVTNAYGCTATAQTTVIGNATDGLMTYFADADGDGFGSPTSTTLACSPTPPTGYVTNSTDCNDGDAAVHTVPAAPSALGTQTFCSAVSPTVATLSATGTDLKWYGTASGGSALAETTALATGTYYVSQRNSCGESTRTPVTVTITNLTLGAPSVTHVACYGGTTGSIAITASGGTGTYTYTLSGSGTGSNTSGTFTGLRAGNYTVSVSDGSTCLATSASIPVTQPTGALTLSLSAGSIQCADGTTTLTATASVPTSGGGGRFANGRLAATTYTYVLTPGNVSNSTGIFTISANTAYTVTATSPEGCTATRDITVSASRQHRPFADGARCSGREPVGRLLHNHS